ncbi:hypothetical protein CHS0354_016117 [Potamilus streckersoni]|uniref:Uncharacterized protein n=1 Tax=Potamilus streckersoni TaxID=2493646 RepID=A0AAE0W5F4_9BIVA|nr:hypothetical protein CHS0354_016117 [Potamilus streckersoni]
MENCYVSSGSAALQRLVIAMRSSSSLVLQQKKKSTWFLTVTVNFGRGGLCGDKRLVWPAFTILEATFNESETKVFTSLSLLDDVYIVDQVNVGLLMSANVTRAVNTRHSRGLLRSHLVSAGRQSPVDRQTSFHESRCGR